MLHRPGPTAFVVASTAGAEAPAAPTKQVVVEGHEIPLNVKTDFGTLWTFQVVPEFVVPRISGLDPLTARTSHTAVEEHEVADTCGALACDAWRTAAAAGKTPAPRTSIATNTVETGLTIGFKDERNTTLPRETARIREQVKCPINRSHR